MPWPFPLGSAEHGQCPAYLLPLERPIFPKLVRSKASCMCLFIKRRNTLSEKMPKMEDDLRETHVMGSSREYWHYAKECAR